MYIVNTHACDNESHLLLCVLFAGRRFAELELTVLLAKVRHALTHSFDRASIYMEAVRQSACMHIYMYCIIFGMKLLQL